LGDLKQQKFQKLVYFAEKVGILGEQDKTADQDLKEEIEEV
jgi:hypothetical protein